MTKHPVSNEPAILAKALELVLAATTKAARAAESRRLGARLVRIDGERIFLDELDPKAFGRPMKTVVVDCGIFCEEPA